MNILERFIGILAPFTCVGCGAEGALLCAKCMPDMPQVPSRCYRCQRVTDRFRTCLACRRHSNLYAVHVRTPYDGMARQVLHAIKFERASMAAQAIAHSLVPALPQDSTVITHVPTANQRIRMRGYDQAQLIARHLARDLDSDYIPLLLRVGTARQVGKKRQQRLLQAPTFLPSHSATIKNKHVLLIDDVITTGATLEAAAKVLRQAGAKRVSAVVFAAA